MRRQPAHCEIGALISRIQTTMRSPEYLMQKTFVKAGGSTIELHLNDCFVGMERMDRGSVDVVVTSPPYNIGVKYGVYDDGITRQKYLDWIEEWAKLVSQVLSPSGSLFLNIGGKPKDPWVPLEAAFRLKKYFQLQNTIHWIKSIAIPKATNGDDHGLKDDVNVGPIKPINSRRYLSDAQEYVFHFTTSGSVELDRLAIGVPYKHKSNITRWKSAGTDIRCRGNTWFIPYKTIVSRKRDRPHPASFPPELAEMCIKLHGLARAHLVLDPFMGLGHTAIACARIGISCIGFEIDPDYFETSCIQVARAVGSGSGEAPRKEGPLQVGLFQ
jgi:site-specific DNA-methyltransferase (adenine-specific)